MANCSTRKIGSSCTNNYSKTTFTHSQTTSSQYTVHSTQYTVHSAVHSTVHTTVHSTVQHSTQYLQNLSSHCRLLDGLLLSLHKLQHGGKGGMREKKVENEWVVRRDLAHGSILIEVKGRAPWVAMQASAGLTACVLSSCNSASSFS
jgi:hypothetical protein